MRKFLERTALFVIGIPILVCLILFLPHYHHGVWNILIIFLTAAGAYELIRIFPSRGKMFHPVLYAIAAALLPASEYISILGGFPPGASMVIFIFLTAFILCSTVFPSGLTILEQTSEQSSEQIPALANMAFSLTALLYPGLFMIFIIRLSTFPEPEKIILFFLLLVFSNDTFAYIIGTLFGRYSKKPFAISPNKSVIGYAGGMLFSVLTGMIFSSLLLMGSYSGGPIPFLILCVLVTVTSNLGDLVESAMKRSAGIKDSGNSVPGRGGILDSIDSVVMSAPFFFYFVQAFLV